MMATLREHRFIRATFELLRDSFKAFFDDSAPLLGAGIAYYALFSLAPLLVFGVAIAGMIFGDEAAQGVIDQQLRGYVGYRMAATIEELLANSAQEPASGLLASIISFGVLVFGAHMAFAQLQRALNIIWDVPIADLSFRDVIRQRLKSLLLVLGVGLALIVMLLASATLSLVEMAVGMGVAGWVQALGVLDVVVFIAMMTVFIAMVYRVLPDVDIQTRDVVVGAFVTSCLLYLGKFGIGVYLRQAGLSSTYGAAGSVVALLVWIYLSSQIFLWGAEFTQVWAHRFGRAFHRGRLPAVIDERVEGEEPG